MLDILKYPDERLKQVSTPVERFDASLHQLLDDMAVTMYHSNGIGLAAPQVGQFIRLFIIDIASVDSNSKHLQEFINPKISNGEGKTVFEEGCLSVPGVTEEVVRKEKITVTFHDRFGKEQQLTTDGLLAVAIQHENDHLDGVLFLDRLSPLKRQFVKRRLEKAVTL